MCSAHTVPFSRRLPSISQRSKLLGPATLLQEISVIYQQVCWGLQQCPREWGKRCGKNPQNSTSSHCFYLIRSNTWLSLETAWSVSDKLQELICMQSSFGKPSLLLVSLWLPAQEVVIWGWSMRWLINWFEGMKLEILERSGHMEGWQPTSLTPQHARICSSCSQGSVTEHNSHTTQERESVSHSCIRASKIRSKRKAWSLPWPKQDSLSHIGNIHPLYGFPLPFDTYKQSSLYTNTTWERRCETHFHITRDGFVSGIHSAIEVCAQGDLHNLQKLLFIFI